MPVNHTCPYCRHKIVLQDADMQADTISFKFSDDRIKHGKTGALLVSYACPNPDCRELSINVSWEKLTLSPETGDFYFQEGYYAKPLAKWQLRPESSAKPQPDYIPPQLVEDYNEACRIRDLSPKASATLSRRCLQGMIRDFWNVKGKRNLHQEIEAIKGEVDRDMWEAIEAVRSVGNIGAHMEKDVNLIVSVEPEEARLLLELIETLFDEWYVVRYERKQRTGKIKRLGEEKEAARRKSTDPAARNP